jgi:predicted flavoprotein YhiN
MKYDIIVIGGGPAGMMSAGRAGELGVKVLLLEKNRDPGIKLLLTGKDRCNLTNGRDDVAEIVEKFGPQKGRFLYSALYNFGPEEVINFFEARGLKTKMERGGRIFPVSDKSLDVRKTLLEYLKKSKVEVRLNAPVKQILTKNNQITEILLKNGTSVSAKKVILATGGKSYPVTGSTGDGYNWLEDLGHQLVEPRPALTPIFLAEPFINKLEGLSLKNVEISLYEKGKKIDSRFGEAMFTYDGMSGPIIIDMSKKIGEVLIKNKVDFPQLRTGERKLGEVIISPIQIKIDFKPALDFTKLDESIQRRFQEGNNKVFKNVLDKLLPKKILPTILKLSEIDLEKKVNLITKEERHRLVKLLKEFTLNVTNLVGFKKAIVTAGGVKLTEVDSQTMQSKIIENLYFAGEVLDLDGPTGGYNLQSCWSTGYLAGESSAQKLLESKND